MSTQNRLKGVIDAEIEKLLKSVAEEEDFSDYKIEKAPGSTKGDGYMGVLTSIRITGTGKSTNNKKELNLILKSASKSEALRKEAPISSAYQTEIYMYNDVIPAFQTFIAQKGLLPFSSSAKCYKACLIDKSEALIMEDLKTRGYSVWERRKPMEHEHIAFIMKEYGRFHALSYALRDQDPEIFEKLTQSMEDVLDQFLKTSENMKMFTSSCEKALMSLYPETDKKALVVFKKFIEEDLEGFLIGLSSHHDKFSAILHGDCWTNNMMFKYDDEANPTKPTKMCFIDLQVSRVGSPALDLSYFLYGCSSKAVITDIDTYLNIYYSSLSSYLKTLGSDPDEVYPYYVFRQHWKDLSKFGLITSMLLIYVMLSEENEVTDFIDVTESGKSLATAFNYTIGNMDVYNDRVRHVILHFVNNNLVTP